MTDLARPSFEVWSTWTEEPTAFTPGEAWLDLLHTAGPDGVLPVTSYTERWGWKNQEVADFFVALGRHGHLRPYDKSRWQLAYQAPAMGPQYEYEFVWLIYPKRVAKSKGYHAYCATRKGSGDRDHGPATARELYDATQRYAIARKDEDAEFILNASTFFGPDERWKEKHRPKTNSRPKGEKGWSRPTSRDLTQGAGTKGRSRKTTTKVPPKKKGPPKNPRTPRKKRDDPLGDL